MTKDTPDVGEFRKAISRERREAMAAGKAFANACREGDLDAFAYAVHRLSNETYGGWPLALRYASRLDNVPPEIRDAFLCAWIESKSIARHFESHPPVIKALRVLMPAYTGPEVRLYRGETMRAWRHRTYGISWTTDLATAEKFATDARRCIEGGSCILETIAPPEAILGTTELVGDYYNEREYLIDRRGLDAVTVIRRYPQISVDEYREIERGEAAATA